MKEAGPSLLIRRLPLLLTAMIALVPGLNETVAQTPVRQWYVEAPSSQCGELWLDRRLIGVPAAAAFIVPQPAYYFVGFKDTAFANWAPGVLMPEENSPLCFQAIRSKEDWGKPGRHLLLNFIQQPAWIPEPGAKPITPVREALVRTITAQDGRTTIFVEPRP
jgi:hypothetical protein